jgi:ATP-dependent DNA helicase RecG
MKENSLFDKKSLSLIQGSKADWKELAKDCVCFANAIGGEIHIGIEDDETQPPAHQKIKDELLEKILKTIPSLTINVGIAVRKEVAENGGEYLILSVYRSSQTIASTSNGKYYIRVSDECKPVLPDEMARLASDKSAFIWEEKSVKRIHFSDCDKDKLDILTEDIINSERISEFVKDMSIEEQLEHYMLTQGNHLTNLGVLWVGTKSQRASLHYAPSVQFIKYDELEKKIYKKVWDDFTKNPKELIDEIINHTPDWNEFVEISDGIFRKNIYNYDPDVVRELLANAFAHRNYSMRGDIFMNLYTDRLEIHSPGLLPLGVTPQNILTKSVQRNQHLSKLFYDLKLMEKEGSGYDKVYEILLSNAKKPPLVEEGDDRVAVTVFKNILSKDVLKIMQKASSEFQLKQRETISLGLIAQKGDVQAIELSELLNVKRPNGLQTWLGRLLDFKLILSKGKTKGTLYYVNPDFLRNADFRAKTNLKRIEPYRLKELVLADLKDYPNSPISEINKRIGAEINPHTLKRRLDQMINDDLLEKKGVNRWTKYSIKQKRMK